jgi:hypothetical protein
MRLLSSMCAVAFLTLTTCTTGQVAVAPATKPLRAMVPRPREEIPRFLETPRMKATRELIEAHRHAWARANLDRYLEGPSD